MTEHTDTEDERTGTERSTLGDITHTNPYTGRTFGNTQTYERGRTVAADGGEAGAVDDGAGTHVDDEAGAGVDEAADAEDAVERDIAEEELRDVDHTAPGDAEGTNQVYERGGEGRDEKADE